MRAEYSSVHCGTTHPDHDTIATFRRRFAGEIKALFVQVLLIARANRLLKLGNIALDGTRVKANASRHSTEFARLQAGTLHAKLLKIGAVIIRNTRRVRVLLSSAFPYQDIFRHAARTLRSP